MARLPGLGPGVLLHGCRGLGGRGLCVLACSGRDEERGRRSDLLQLARPTHTSSAPELECKSFKTLVQPCRQLPTLCCCLCWDAAALLLAASVLLAALTLGSHSVQELVQSSLKKGTKATLCVGFEHSASSSRSAGTSSRNNRAKGPQSRVTISFLEYSRTPVNANGVISGPVVARRPHPLAQSACYHPLNPEKPSISIRDSAEHR